MTITTVDQAKTAGAFDAQYGAGAYNKAPASETSLFMTDPTSLTNFKQANPSLYFTPDDLAHYNAANPVKVAPQPLSTAATGLLGTVEATNQQNIDQQAANFAKNAVGSTDELKTKDNYFKALYTKYFSENKGQTALADSAYKDTVDPAKQELTNITNEINAKQLSFRREIEAAKDAIGGTSGGNAANAALIERRAASELADLSVIQQAKSNNYANAKEIADRKVAMQLEDQKNQFDALQFFYKDNKDELNEKQREQFQTLITERSRLLNQQETEKKAINDIGLEYLKSGGDTATAKKIFSSPDQKTAAVLAGNVIGSLDRQYKQSQINENNRQASNLATSFKFTSDDKQMLVGSNIPGNDLSAIENDINKFGLDAVLNNPNALGAGKPFSDAQKSTVKQVVSKGNTLVTPKNVVLDDNYFTKVYGNGLEKAATDAGYTKKDHFWSSPTADTSAFLKHLQEVVQIYRDQGYSDAEILKMMQ